MREQVIDWTTVEEEIGTESMDVSYLLVLTRMRASKDHKNPSKPLASAGL